MRVNVGYVMLGVIANVHRGSGFWQTMGNNLNVRTPFYKLDCDKRSLPLGTEFPETGILVCVFGNSKLGHVY